MNVPDERPAQPGEYCTCGRPAILVFDGGPWGATGYCGTPGVSSVPCPWCGKSEGHTGRCAAYRLTGPG